MPCAGARDVLSFCARRIWRILQKQRSLRSIFAGREYSQSQWTLVSGKQESLCAAMYRKRDRPRSPGTGRGASSADPCALWLPVFRMSGNPLLLIPLQAGRAQRRETSPVLRAASSGYGWEEMSNSSILPESCGPNLTIS